MTDRLRKSLKAIALVTLSLPILAAMAVVVIANTESGTRWALEKAATMVPGVLEAGEFDGTLWSGMRFPAISYRDREWRIDAVALELRFDMLDLVARRVTIRNLAAGSIAYRDLSVEQDEAKPLELSRAALPLTIIVNKGHVREFIVAGQKETRISDLAIDEGWFNGRRIRAGTVSATIDTVSLSAANASLFLDGRAPLSAALRWRLIGDEWSGRGNVHGTLVEIGFDQFVEGPYPATISGVVTPGFGSAPAIDALVNWERWLIGGRLVDDGEARVRGWLDAYVLEFDAGLQLTDELRTAVSGDASGTSTGIDRFDAKFESGQGMAESSGSILWKPAFELVAELIILDADAATVVPGLAGRMSGDVRLHYDDTEALDIYGELLFADSKLLADGALTADELSIALKFDVPRIEVFSEGVTGSATGTGRLSGTLQYPVLAFDLKGREIRPDVSSAPALDIGMSGNLRRADSGLVSAIRTATISEPATGTWTLTRPTEAQFRDGLLAVAAHAWSGTNGDVEVEHFELGQGAANVVAAINNLPLSLADSWLPPDVRLIGTADASINLVRSNDYWSGTATWHQKDTILRILDPGAPQADIRVPRVYARAGLEAGRLSAQADLAVEPGVTANLEMQLSEFSKDADLSAELQLHGDDWAWITAVVPQIDRFEGSVSAKIMGQGTLGSPDLTGTLEWRDGRLEVPYLNVPFDDIDVVVTGDRRGTATLEGSAHAGGGTLAVTGRFTEIMSRSRSLQLSVQGKSAELLNWPEYHVWASPDLTVTVDTDGWRFDGELAIPKADIAVRELPEGAVTVSPDVRVLGEEVAPDRTSRITGETRLNLGDRVHINAMGLDSDLRGSLLLRARPNRDLTAAGKISLVDGTFIAYERELSIRHGELTFTGPLDDPIVDVRAVRKIETFDGTVTAGIHLTGRAQNLTATVFSEPAMADADALSYLVVGRPLNQATEAESQDLSGAAVALGLRQANRLVDQIGQTIGLDQLSLAGDGGESTALVAGKQLNRRLYARYSYGVFSRLGSFLLRYRMTETLTLEAATGEYQSIDVVYSVETP